MGICLESICVDKEWAVKLKESGYPQDSLFYWYDDSNVLYLKDALGGDIYDEKIMEKYFSAPTAEEILKWLPDYYTYNETVYCLEIVRVSVVKRKNAVYKISYRNINYFGKDRVGEEDKKPCNALARMCLFLDKKGLLEDKGESNLEKCKQPFYDKSIMEKEDK